MKKIINSQTALLAVGVLQPATPGEVRGFLVAMFREVGGVPRIAEIAEFLKEQVIYGRVLEITIGKISYFSLTLHGSLYLSPHARKMRDKFRAYLLRDAHRARFITSRGVGDGLAGVSPAVDNSSQIKGRAANKVGRSASGRRFANGRPYWPRIQEQFTKRAGPNRPPRDTFPSLLSFENEEQARIASGRAEFQFDYVGIGVCLGLSPQLIWNISRTQDKYYRTFEIKKKGGGVRSIESPRVFLKVIQWFLADYVLDDLPVHESVHSFSIGRSIVTNALPHVHKEYVGSVDIRDFFGSITEDKVIQHLKQNNFLPAEAVSIAKLCTNRGVLPQGAPTSPVISNSLLFGVDQSVVKFCRSRSLEYTRYADDVTISGRSIVGVNQGLRVFDRSLGFFSLHLNEDKTRVARSSGQQRVTGVVVNQEASPPRAFRRRVRAAFHQVSKDLSAGLPRLPELAGLLGYLRMFPKLARSAELARYEAVVLALKERKQAFQAP